MPSAWILIPYADYDAMSNWMKELNDEYPNYNVVGETWVTEPAYTAWWQKIPCPPPQQQPQDRYGLQLLRKVNTMKYEETDPSTGLNRIYNSFVYDFLYPNPAMVLAFYENHDTNRYLGRRTRPANPQASRGASAHYPSHSQLYYGTEVMMNGVKDKVTVTFAKTSPADGWMIKENAFTSAGRSRFKTNASTSTAPCVYGAKATT